MDDSAPSGSQVPTRATASTLVVWHSRSTANIIREITCLTCSCIKGIRTLEFSEDIAQTFRSCPANTFVALSKNRRAKEVTTPRRNSFSRSSFVRRYFGYYNYNIEPFPVYQREGSSREHRESNRSYSSVDSPTLNTGNKSGNICENATGETVSGLQHSNTPGRSSPVSGGVTKGVTNERAPIVDQETTQQRQELPDFLSTDRNTDRIAVETQEVDRIISARQRKDKLFGGHSPGKMRANSGKKPVRVHLLTGDSILLVFDAKATVKDVFDQVCALHSIKESHFFGLSAFIENELRFLDPKQRLNKYAPKEWGKELKRRDSDLSVQPSAIFTVQFQVQYFVEHPKLIRDPKSRFYYYLQLKKNVLQSKVPTQEAEVFTLAATSLHLDMGTFDPNKHVGRYFDPNEYVPAWFAKKWSADYLWSHLPTMHAELASTSPFDCHADYISRASTIEDVPVHYYKLYKTKKELESSVILGIYHQGIRVHHITKDGSHLLDFEFPWAKVGRLFFAARRFDIYPEDLPASRKLTYYTGSQSRSKYLLRLLRETHSLYMSLTPYVQHMRNTDGRQARREYRESYISGQDLEKGKFGEERLVGDVDDYAVSPSSNKSKDSRDKLYKSYNSSTSHGSSHTSGIESDSKQRTEEEEDDSAFANDFDPIEHDRPPGGGVICITQEHLEAPQHKSLSVTDLTEESPSESRENLNEVQEPETSSEKSEQTIKAANAEEAIIPPPSNDQPPSPNRKSPEPVECPPSPKLVEVETNNNNSNSICVETLILETNSLPPKTAELRVLKAERPLETDMSTKDDPLPLETLFLNSAAEAADKPHVVLEERNASPDYLSRPKRSGSRTYYDDTETVLAQTRSQSTDLDYGRTATTPDKSSRKHGARKHRHKRSSRASGSMQRSGSVDSSLHTQQGSRPLFKHERHSRKDHQRHQRHKSLQENPVSAGVPVHEGLEQLVGPHFGTVPSAKKSVDDLCDGGPLTRSHRERDLAFSITHPEVEPHRPLDQRKMSDACHRTLAAQHRKLSDSRIQRQQEQEPSPKPSRPKKHSSSSSKPNGQISSAGNTPHKHEVLLRTKHERAHEDRRRPVSYHLASGALPPSYAAHQQSYSCYNDAALTSRPPVLMDGFKEVIV